MSYLLRGLSVGCPRPLRTDRRGTTQQRWCASQGLQKIVRISSEQIMLRSRNGLGSDRSGGHPSQGQCVRTDRSHERRRWQRGRRHLARHGQRRGRRTAAATSHVACRACAPRPARRRRRLILPLRCTTPVYHKSRYFSLYINASCFCPTRVPNQQNYRLQMGL